MIRSILFPLRTRSLNVSFRGGNHYARSSATKRERAVTALALSDARFGPAPTIPDICARSRARRGPGLIVTICRISPSRLDYPANLGGALKGVQDQIAAWVELSDRDSRIKWLFRQARCETAPRGTRSYQGVRIRIDDIEGPGPDVDLVLGRGPARIGPESEDGEGAPPPISDDRSAPVPDRFVHRALGDVFSLMRRSGRGAR